jgi:hypothetical protein
MKGIIRFLADILRRKANPIAADNETGMSAKAVPQASVVERPPSQDDDSAGGSLQEFIDAFRSHSDLRAKFPEDPLETLSSLGIDPNRFQSIDGLTQVEIASLRHQLGAARRIAAEHMARALAEKEAEDDRAKRGAADSLSAIAPPHVPVAVYGPPAGGRNGRR